MRVPEAAVALLLSGAAACAHQISNGAQPVSVSATEEAEIRRVISDRVEALRARDAERLVASLSPSVISFEMVPPLSLPPGAAAETEQVRTWLQGWKAVDVQIRDLAVHASGDIAFCHSLNRLSGTTRDNREVSIWMRSTLGLRKLQGEWKIVHSHTSVPFLTDGSAKAALDLVP